MSRLIRVFVYALCDKHSKEEKQLYVGWTWPSAISFVETQIDEAYDIGQGRSRVLQGEEKHAKRGKHRKFVSRNVARLRAVDCSSCSIHDAVEPKLLAQSTRLQAQKRFQFIFYSLESSLITNSVNTIDIGEYK